MGEPLELPIQDYNINDLQGLPTNAHPSNIQSINLEFLRSRTAPSSVPVDLASHRLGSQTSDDVAKNGNGDAEDTNVDVNDKDEANAMDADAEGDPLTIYWI